MADPRCGGSLPTEINSVDGVKNDKVPERVQENGNSGQMDRTHLEA